MTATKTKPRLKAPAKVIRHCEFIPGGIHYFEMDASKRDMKHVQEICVESGLVRCSCEHFTMRHAKHEPTLATPQFHCKHISSAVEWLLDNSFLEKEDLELAALVESLHPCMKCQMPDADVLVYDEQGRHIQGLMCAHCLEEARAKSEPLSDDALILQADIERETLLLEALEAELRDLPDLLTVRDEIAAKKMSIFELKWQLSRVEVGV